jgi:FkbM family methyltransferase
LQISSKVALLQSFDTIYCVEANPEIYENIRSHQNDNTKIFNLAIGKENKSVSFYTNKIQFEIGSLNYKWINELSYNSSIIKENIVQQYTLDTFISNMEIENISVMKIDIEGYEFFALNNSNILKNGRPLIVFECTLNEFVTENLYNDIEEYVDAYYNIFEKNNYIVTDLFMNVLDQKSWKDPGQSEKNVPINRFGIPVEYKDQIEGFKKLIDEKLQIYK